MTAAKSKKRLKVSVMLLKDMTISEDGVSTIDAKTGRCVTVMSGYATRMIRRGEAKVTNDTGSDAKAVQQTDTSDTTDKVITSKSLKHNSSGSKDSGQDKPVD